MQEKNELERQLAIIEGQLHNEYNQNGQQNIGWIENKVGELKISEEKLNAQLSNIFREVEKNREEEQENKKLVENLSIEQTQLKLKISRLQSQLFKDQSEQNYLQLSGLTAVRAVLEEGKRFGKVYGLVAQLAEAKEEYRLALEVAAGSHLSSIIVGDEQVARLAIEYLRENKFGFATFLPLNKIEPRGSYGDANALQGEKGVLGKAIDLIKFDSKFANIFSLIFGNTLVIEDLRVAERIGIGRARMVTLAGDVVEQRGIMRGGYRNRKSNLSFSSQLSLNGEGHVEEIQSQMNLETHNLSELEGKLEAAKIKLMSATVLVQSVENHSSLIKAEQQHAEAERIGLEQELLLLKASPKEYGEQLKKLAEEKEKFLEKKDVVLKNVAEAATEIEGFNKREEEKKQRIFSLQEQMQKYQEEVNSILTERNDFHIQLAKVETKQEDLAQEVMNDMKISVLSIVERMGDVVGVGVNGRSPLPDDLSFLQNLADQIEKLKYQLSLIGGIDEEVVKEYGDTKERYDFLTGQLSDLRKATDDLQKMIAELDELMKKKRADAFKKIRKEFDRYFKILFDGGKADLEEVYGVEDVGEEAMDSNSPLGRGRGGLDNVGEPTPARLNSPPRPSGDFDDDARLTKRDKILTGIDVIANPPGKKVKYLSMLSGGERTLTSIALICAILYHNPSPFVVLDEVEAALDEANTMRFAKIMAELSTHSQFIIVTHNRVTMHAANALYGVVMGVDGISKLLSVKMEDVPTYESPVTVDKSSNM